MNDPLELYVKIVNGNGFLFSPESSENLRFLMISWRIEIKSRWLFLQKAPSCYIFLQKNYIADVWQGFIYGSDKGVSTISITVTLISFVLHIISFFLPFLASVAFFIETSHLICTVNQLTGFCIDDFFIDAILGWNRLNSSLI